MKESAPGTPVDRHWSQFLGVSPKLLHEPGVTVVPHHGLAGWRGVWFFFRGASCIVSAPEDWTERLSSLRTVTSQRSLTDDVLMSIFGEHLGKVVGPAYHGHVNPERFRP